MGKLSFVATAIAAGMVFSSPAMAVDNTSTQTIPLVPAGPGSYSATWTATPGQGSFLNTFLFQLPQSGRVSVKLSSTETAGPPTNVNFNATRVTFNGVKLPVLSRGVFELRSLVGLAVNSGLATLSVQGASGAAGSYTGTLAYAIPEPATWAFMILGFGMIGSALRLRRRESKAGRLAVA